jgi:NAD-dependent histone deacetylase SIR2
MVISLRVSYISYLLRQQFLRTSLVPGACTLEESRSYRSQLRLLGIKSFFEVTVEAGIITAKKLLTAFSIWIEEDPDHEDPDESYYELLERALKAELRKRRKLQQFNSIDDAVSLLERSKNIIVLTGAGISTSLGIPDFRSKDIGLYTKLAELGLDDPQDVFNIDIFRDDPTTFYTIAKDILPPHSGAFTPTHAFIRLLQDKGKLLTNYSQNIDNIEAAAGVKKDKLVQCHGSFATATCLKCGTNYDGMVIMPDLKAGRVARCPECIRVISKEVTGMKRKRSHSSNAKKRQRRSEGFSDSSSEDDGIPEAGVLKPDITFFGEELPDNFYDRLTKHDNDLVDLVIVIGTSLKVAPVSEVVPYLPSSVPQLIITRERVKHFEFDVEMLGDCDVVVAELCRRLQWELKHEMIPDGQQVNITLLPNPYDTEENPKPPIESAHVFKVRN